MEGLAKMCRDNLWVQTQCPFYVARTVWEQAASPLRLSKVHMIAVHEDAMTKQQEQMQASQHHTQEQQNVASGSVTIAPNGIGESRSGGGSGALSPTAYEYMTIKPDDLDDIKLLKRELAIAVHEEDYVVAARLRDHPYMQLYRRIEAFQLLGRATEAQALQQDLANMVARKQQLQPMHREGEVTH
ncbi:hypothetical protein Vretimale_4650 [Volvox reticuliferus]|uniref:Uncharacterized protein n=1 Tax=Volvox reticuliferus TaxID=1737510 RepID=A0A8J4C1R8_9CHLO|nr:hypothetical protein Vretifemale_3255 [Volvox reticuliferus]GIL99495.1 hypothetical protein Vretimale_4650 [Volvox reticuliferus]